MTKLVALFFSLLLASSSLALPSGSRPGHGLGVGPVLQNLFCLIPFVRTLPGACPHEGFENPIVNTPLGAAHGAVVVSSVTRYPVKYGQASRWQPSSVVASWQLPNGNTDASQLPLACPQSPYNATLMDEDCLSMILYVPSCLSSQPGNAPTMLWIHGGSSVSGSATGPGLDGSNLAVATSSIVAVVQYRLGALGLMSPSHLNLALSDVVTALQFLQKVVPSFGGSASRITVAGQSSGAHMIRGLLATPSAANLFQYAILQSDPMDYGFQSLTAQQTLQSYFNNMTCSAGDTACWSALELSDIVLAQENLADAAPTLADSVGIGEPLRVVHDGALITTTLDSSMPFPQVSKHIMVTNVKNEAGLQIYTGATVALDTDVYEYLVEQTFGDNATTLIMNNPNYAAFTGSSASDQRPVLEKLGTDQIWRCPGWTLARNWVANSGTAYVGMYMLGASYPGNNATSFCTQSGSVCHQDDIEIVFGTAPNPTRDQSKLIIEMQARYKSFLYTGNPNTPGYATWSAATTSNVHALEFGGSGEVAAGGCDPSFFGSAIPYDYQLFDV